MVLSLKQTQSNIPKSSSSSCTEFISEVRCGSNRCPKCCISSAINDHTYEVLKKICKKIIKDLNRKQCRENYSVFDGGNSIKVKIQRGQNEEYDKSSSKINTNKFGKTDSSYITNQARSRQRKYGKELDTGDSDVLGKKHGRAQSKNNKTIGEYGDDSYGDKTKASKTGSAKSKKNMDMEEDDYDPHSKKSRNRKPGKEEYDLENENNMSKAKSKGKGRPEDDDEENIKRKKGKGKSKGDDDYEEAESKKNKSKQDKSKEKRPSGDDADYDDSYDQRRGSKSKRKRKGMNMVDEDDIQADKGKEGSQKSKLDIPIITDLRSKVRKGQEVSPEGKQGSSKKSKKDRDRLASLDKELTQLKKKQKTGRQLLTDQQENSRSRGKSGKGNNRTKGQRSSSRQYSSRSAHGLGSEARIPSRLSRGDQIRPCDILRANMEQRDLCRLCDQICMQKPCRDPCNNRTCARNVCSEVIQSCYCPSSACCKRFH